MHFCSRDGGASEWSLLCERLTPSTSSLTAVADRVGDHHNECRCFVVLPRDQLSHLDAEVPVSDAYMRNIEHHPGQRQILRKRARRRSNRGQKGSIRAQEYPPGPLDQPPLWLAFF